MTMDVMTQDVGYVDSSEQLAKLLEHVEASQEEFKKYTQEQVDKIFKHCAMVATQYRVQLAQLAVDEAGMGIVEDKAIKNQYAAETIYSAYKDMKTCGVVEDDGMHGYALYAEPVGVLAGVVPCTNPTSTTIFKCLIALKTRNCIVISPHPRTVKCTIAAASIVLKAAIEAGAPKHCIGWIDKASIDLCTQLMRHPKVSMIVATGAGGLIKSAYSSGKPCMGGSSGNTPVIIDETCDISMAVNSVILSKTFDNGMICASEQAVVAVESIADRVKEEFKKRGGYFLQSEDEKKKLGDFIFKPDGALNPSAVGKSAADLMQLSECTDKHPEHSRLLLVELDNIGTDEMLSREKLCPCLGFYKAKDYDEALDKALQLVRFGGLGHTSVLYTDLHGETKKERVGKFQAMMPTGRTLLCMPTSHGGIGGIFNAKQPPSLTLGCGTWGGNSSAEGLQPKHLLNYKQVAERRDHAQGFTLPKSVIFGTHIIEDSFQHLEGIESIRGVGILYQDYHQGTHKSMQGLQRVLTTVQHAFQQHKDIHVTMLSHGLTPDTLVYAADIAGLQSLVAQIHSKSIDTIVAIGDTPILDVAKLLRVAVEDPTICWKDMGARFMSLSQKITKCPQSLKIKKLICIPTTSGGGAEITSYANLVDTTEKTPTTNKVLTIIDTALTPDVAIIDYDIPAFMPKQVAIESGCVALASTLESLVSSTSTEYTRHLSEEAFHLLTQYFVPSITTDDTIARSECHRAATVAGMAAANAFLGITEALASQLVQVFKLSPGIAKLLILPHVILFNAQEAPKKFPCYPQYEKPKAASQYIHAMKTCHLFSKLPEETPEMQYVQELMDYLTELPEKLGLHKTIQAYGISEKEFMAHVDTMALAAFDHQFTQTNPRYPLITELASIYVDTYYGKFTPM